MEVIVTKEYSSPFGEMVIGSYMGQICLCDWKYRKMRHAVDRRITKGLHAEYKEGESKVIDECMQQLEAYFKQDVKKFNLPLLMEGTDFQKGVWTAIGEIPYGKTETYLELARKLGNEQSLRAVAAANGANALAILVPCHRVIGKNGELTGYAGGIRVKQKLIELENEHTGHQIEMSFTE